MKYLFCPALGLSLFLGVSSCRPSPTHASRQPQQPTTALLKVAEDDYKHGRLESAERELGVVLKREPRNNEAWYYLHSVNDAQAKDRLWYPTLPPKPVR
jgi:hypothetical protein